MLPKVKRESGAELFFRSILNPLLAQILHCNVNVMFRCPYCNVGGYSSFKKLLSHINLIHSHEPNFSITCGNCSRSFTNFNTFKTHIRREKEKEKLARLFEEPVGDHFNDDEGAREGSDEDEIDEDENTETMTRYLALFLLKTKEQNQISQQALNSILENTSDLVEKNLEELKARIKSCLTANNIDIRDVEGLNETMDQPSTFSQAHGSLGSEYLQMKYYVENFNLVEPEEIVLNQHMEYRNTSGRQKLCLVKETFHYISVLRTLESMLNQPDVLAEIHSSHASNDGILRDYCDGASFKEHPLFGQYPHSIVLHCYFDEFQVTNPLGSKTIKHKIGAFYFVLGNLQPRYRSIINIIQLVALCKVSIITKYGMNRILQPFLRDICLLESDHGVCLKVEGLDKIVRGSIGPFSADNLGAHAIGGFTESFSSNCLRICRFCMATPQDIQSKFTEEEFQMRTREAYDGHCQLVQEDPSFGSTYGIKRSCILNESRYFHVIGGLEVDIMHDQLEGVLPLHVKLLLKQYIRNDKLFALDDLNQRIANFSYGLIDKSNKPSQIKAQALAIGNESASMGQRASQMWCLSRMLPLFIGDFVPHDDEHWENYLRLLQIEEIVFAPSTTSRLAAYLQVLIAEYLEEFKRKYERALIPKQHFMVHYPKQILRDGPLVRNWAMRFEAKHNYFKKLAHNLNNFKNITYSLSRRHQALQAFLMQSSAGNFLRLSLEVGPGSKASIDELGLYEELHDLHQGITRYSSVASTSWVKVFGTLYAKNCVLVIGICHGDPVLGQMKQVLVVDGSTVVFQYNCLQILEYTVHLNAYKVRVQNETAYVKQDSLQDFHPLSVNKGFGCYRNQKFVVLKYRIDPTM